MDIFAAEALQATLARGERSVELAFRVRDIYVRETKKQSTFFKRARGYSNRSQPSDEGVSASTLLKAFATKTETEDETNDAQADLDPKSYVEVYSSEIHPRSENPTFMTCLVLDMDDNVTSIDTTSVNEKTGTGQFHLRFELFVSTRASANYRKFVHYAKVNVSLAEILSHCGYRHDGSKATKSVGWGSFQMKTIHNDICVLDVRVVKAPRLVCVQVPRFGSHESRNGTNNKHKQKQSHQSSTHNKLKIVKRTNSRSTSHRGSPTRMTSGTHPAVLVEEDVEEHTVESGQRKSSRRVEVVGKVAGEDVHSSASSEATTSASSSNPIATPKPPRRNSARSHFHNSKQQDYGRRKSYRRRSVSAPKSKGLHRHNHRIKQTSIIRLNGKPLPPRTIKCLPWRAEAPLEAASLVGVINAPISRTFAIECDLAAEESFNHLLWKKASSVRKMSATRPRTRSRFASNLSTATAGTTSAQPVPRQPLPPADFVEMREELAELPIGLLIPCLYLEARASEISRFLEGFRAEIRIEIAMVRKLTTAGGVDGVRGSFATVGSSSSGRPSRSRFESELESRGSPSAKSSVSGHSGTAQTTLRDVHVDRASVAQDSMGTSTSRLMGGSGASNMMWEDITVQIAQRAEEEALARHTAWAAQVVDSWTGKRQELTRIAKYYRKLWKNVVLDDTPDEAKHPEVSTRISRATTMPEGSPAQQKRRSNATARVVSPANKNKKHTPTDEQDDGDVKNSGIKVDAGIKNEDRRFGKSEDLITSLRRVSTAFAINPESTLRLDASLAVTRSFHSASDSAVDIRPASKNGSLEGHHETSNSMGGHHHESMRRPIDSLKAHHRPSSSAVTWMSNTSATPVHVDDSTNHEDEKHAFDALPMDITFRSSTEKENKLLRFLPINLHLQVLTVGHVRVKPTPQSESLDAQHHASRMQAFAGMFHEAGPLEQIGQRMRRRSFMPAVVSSAVSRGRSFLGRRGSVFGDYVEIQEEDEYAFTDSMLPDSTDIAVFTDSLSMLPRMRSARRQSSNLLPPNPSGNGGKFLALNMVGRTHERLNDEGARKQSDTTWRGATDRDMLQARAEQVAKEAARRKTDADVRSLTEAADEQQQQQRKENEPAVCKYYESITVGATAAHHLGFDRGGLRSMLKQEGQSQAAWHRMRDHGHEGSAVSIESKLDAARRWHDVQMDIVERQDTIYPQALAALTSAILARLHVLAAYGSASRLAKQEQQGVEDDGYNSDEEREEHEALLEHGFLVGWESLLSAWGKERGMLHDLASAVEWLRENIFFRIVMASSSGRTDDNNHRSSTSRSKSHGGDSNRGGGGVVDAKMHRIQTQDTRGVFVAVGSGNTFKGAAEDPWLITLRLSRATVQRLPSTIRKYVKRSTISKLAFVKKQGGAYKVVDMASLVKANAKPLRATCLLFTQGINEGQTMAIAKSKMIVASNDTIQEHINLESLTALGEYCAKRFSSYVARDVTAYGRQTPSASVGSADGIPDVKKTVPTQEVIAVKQAQAQRALYLMANLKAAVQQQTSTVKNLKILALSADLIRWLNGIRLVSCKSAKDRTSMSITLEEARLLVGLHNVPIEDMLPMANVMREHGVRLINVYKNTGVPRYAFNGLQRNFLPLQYRPPINTTRTKALGKAAAAQQQS